MFFLRISSLRTRLALLMLAVAVPALFGALGYLGFLSATIVRNDAERELSTLIQNVAESVERWDQYMVLALENLKGQPDIIGMNADEQRPVLVHMRNTYNRLTIIHTTNLAGMNVARADGKALIDYSDRGWFKEAKSGKPVAREALISRSTGNPALNMSTAIRDRTGAVVGICTAGTDLNTLAGQLGTARLGKTGYVFVVDERGRALAHPDLALASTLKNLSDYAPVRRAIDGQTGRITFDDEQGHTWVANGQRQSNGWFTIGVQRQDELLRGANHVWQIAILTATASAALVLILTWLVATRLIRPIGELTAAARDLSSGQWDRRVPERRADELGLLAKAFNTMADEIGEANENIEQRAAEALRRSEARTQTLVDSAMDAVVTMDHNGRITGWNPQAVTIFGFSRNQAIGRTLADLIVPPQHRDAHRAGLEHFRKTGEGKVLNRRIEVTALRSDGSEFPIELAISPIGSGTEVSFGAFVRDLTERRRAESEREALQASLLTASRQAGMAEVAIGILHNVGNVLNSVNVSTSVLAEMLRKSEVTNLQKASEMLREHVADLPQYLTSDARGQHLPRFLIEVAACLADEQKTLLTEVDSLARGLEHIKYIVSAQQTHAKRGVLLQRVHPRDLIESALEMNRESFERHQIEIERRLAADLVEAPLDKHKILQVLINLLSNAKNAVCDGRKSDRRIVVSMAQAEVGGAVRFQVEDNGVGIVAENLSLIFGHGFTTQEHGHGFGLHSAANAAKEMGGTLTVASDGHGQGATFTLEVPTQPAADAAATTAGTF